MTLAERILNSELYLSGRSFRASQVARELNHVARDVSATLVALRERNVLKYSEGSYQRIIRHWVNAARLDDADGLRAAYVASREAPEAVCCRDTEREGLAEAPRFIGSGAGTPSGTGEAARSGDL